MTVLSPRFRPPARMPSDAKLRRLYRAAVAEARRDEPGQPVATFAQFKRGYRVWLRMANSDPGGNVRL